MATGIKGQAKKQIGQLAKKTFETVKDQPKDTALTALEQLGIGGGKSSSGQAKKPVAGTDEKAKLQQLEEADRAKTARQVSQLKTELEREIERWRRIREEQLKRRREQMEQIQKPPEPPEASLEAPGGKPKRGGLFLRRKKTKTEAAGMKRSG